ncbi:hypothetical protein Hanom_Chr14g01255001 [Helianthus anomalus]
MNSKKTYLVYYFTHVSTSNLPSFQKRYTGKKETRENRCERRQRERDPEPVNLWQPAPRVLASHPQKRSRRVYVSRLGFRSSSSNFRLPPVRFRRGSV